MTTAPKITPSTSATCCRHGVAPTSWPVFRSCRLSLEMVATPKMIAVTNKAKATSALVASASAPGNSSDKDQRNAEHGEDADARNRAVRRADQAGHVAADRGDHDARDEDVEDAETERRAGIRRRSGRRSAKADSSKPIGIIDRTMTRADDGDRNVALGQLDAVLAAGPARAVGGERGGDALDDRPDDLEQGPDRRRRRSCRRR